MSEQKFISRFSPNRTDPEDLERIHVQRQELLEQSVALLRESALTGNKHHLLFVGPRGCGKTHLLALVNHRLNQQADLADRMRVAWLNEDETSTSFLDLLMRIHRALNERHPEQFPSSDLETLYGREPREAREFLGQTVLRRLGERTLLVLVENLDALFKQLEETEQRDWRAFVQDHPVFATAATAQGLFAGVSDRDQPFFGFFDTRHLKPLTVDEAAELLRKIARLNGDTGLAAFLATPRGRARVHAIHHLSGGNHRLYIVLSDFITQESLDDLVRPFEEMVDEQLTPYYQERLRWISPQQRKIVEFLCFRSQPIPVKEIAEKLFIQHNTITNQLKQLREFGYVTGHPRGRETLYELAEPLMRLSMQVKDTHDHQPLNLVVDFLRVWYERDEIERRLVSSEILGPSFQYYAAALAKIEAGEPNLRHQLLRQDLEGVDLMHCDATQIEKLKVLAEDSNAPTDWMKYASVCVMRSQFVKAIEALNNIITSSSASRDQVASALNNRASAHERLGRLDLAIDDLTRAINEPGASVETVALATLNRASAFEKVKKPVEELADYTRVIELTDAPTEWVARALLRRSAAFGNIGQHQNALADSTRLIELSGAPADVIMMAHYNRGLAFGYAGRVKEALADLAKVIDVPHAPAEIVASALNNRGGLFADEGKKEDAIADFTRALMLPGVGIETIATAFVNRGMILESIGRVNEAIADYTNVANQSGAPVEMTIMALVNRGVLYRDGGHIEKAIADHSRAVAKAVALPAESNEHVNMAIGNFACSLFAAGRWAEGIGRLNGVLAKRAEAAHVIPFTSDASVAAIFAQIASPEIWRARVSELAAIYIGHKCLSYLGGALLRHLGALGKSVLNEEGLDQWLAGWESATSQHEEMQLPLRLLRGGIAYLKTQPRDEGVLLQLPKEERSIVRQALGLPEQTE